MTDIQQSHRKRNWLLLTIVGTIMLIVPLITKPILPKELGILAFPVFLITTIIHTPLITLSTWLHVPLFRPNAFPLTILLLTSYYFGVTAIVFSPILIEAKNTRRMATIASVIFLMVLFGYGIHTWGRLSY